MEDFELAESAEMQDRVAHVQSTLDGASFPGVPAETVQPMLCFARCLPTKKARVERLKAKLIPPLTYVTVKTLTRMGGAGYPGRGCPLCLGSI